MPNPLSIHYRTAVEEDQSAVSTLIEPYVAERKLLARDHDELVHLIHNGFVAEHEGQIIGFSAVEIYSAKLGEVLCLAVADTYQGNGVGKKLIEMCVERAIQSRVRELMAISSSEDFFMECGFDFILPEEKKAFFIRTR